LSGIPTQLLERLESSAGLKAALALEAATGSPVSVSGLAGSLKGLFAGMLFAKRKQQLVFVAADEVSANNIWNDALQLLPEEQVLLIGDQFTHTHTAMRSADSTLAVQAEQLRNLIADPVRLAVTDSMTFVQRFPSVKEVSSASVTIRRYDAMKQEDLVSRLAYGGFERHEFVTASGTYAVRGGLVDVFPVGFMNPIRFEFFGDSVDSIREFDATSQRSIRHYDEVDFLAAMFLTESIADERHGTICEYFDPGAMLLIEDMEQMHRAVEMLKYDSPAIDDIQLYSRVFIDPLVRSTPAQYDVKAMSQPFFNNSIKLLQEHLTAADESNTAVFLVAESDQQKRRLEELLLQEETVGPFDAPAREVHLCPLSEGFVLPDASITVLTEHQIFQRKKIHRKPPRRAPGLSLREIQQLREGDYVVHVDKGIGRFAGLQEIKISGGMQETAKVIYAGGDVLYVNLNYINRLQKYTSEEGHAPKLSKLGSGEWDRIKARTKKHLKDIARDLIKLYAKRKMSEGYAFSSDTQWQKEMEASFIYEDTPDQFKATVDVKRDMEQQSPMDRLVCGDVGYGKTEVALRAAFKAVMDGKQVAVLVPTTLLAQQHYNTFHDRLHRYSLEVDSLSRFKSTAQQKELLEKLQSGKLDIVIGTHRLLSADVKFKDLGLLIIDEEHRFGVAAKEKLRKMREHIDTLAMTATPIPRTLNFSLLGARDLSIIETPPTNRLPILTYILPFQDDVILGGIKKECARGGQVYFVHDRVADIELLAEKLRHIAPGYRFAVAHGQMKPAELERIMMRFLERRIDVLVTTKIIESGIDIPNANTIFINRAERFGLAELYQLRGRVGRSNTQAYSYFVVPKQMKVTRDALRRLQAIEEFSELGSGFQLAMRDLEIRGAGNMLGAEQSGFIAEIGFELYMSTLEEAVSELKGEEFSNLFQDVEPPKQPPRPEVIIEVGLDAFLPNEYVPGSTERFELYRRLYNATDESQIADVEHEIIDRFGPAPQQAQNLFGIVRVRLLASRIGLTRVTLDDDTVKLVLPPQDDDVFYECRFQSIVNWVMENSDTIKMEQDARQVWLRVLNIASVAHINALLLNMLSAIE
jgi:transcription-repair coupling factor (superfamily II helicase)